MCLRIAKVVVSNARRAFDREYGYVVPDDMADRALVGMRAFAPFGARDAERAAVIVGVERSEGGGAAGFWKSADASGAPRKLKRLSMIPDSEPLLGAKDFELAAYMRDKYVCTWFEAFSCMLPKGWDRKADAAEGQTARGVRLAVGAGAVRSAIDTYRLKRMQQIKVMERMLAAESEAAPAARQPGAAGASCRPEDASAGASGKPEGASAGAAGRSEDAYAGAASMPIRELAAEAGVSEGVVKTLIRDGWLEAVRIPVDKRPGRDRPYASSAALKPSEEQGRVIAFAEGRLRAREFSEILLRGVTGSGKTEVYMQLAARALEQGRQAIVLVPEISLTPQMTDRFKSRFGEKVAIFHSRLSDGERGDQWRRVRNGGASIAIGARSAVFAPFADIGLIVVDEEHESSYRSEMAPRYHAADVARFRCKSHGALLLFGSATPSVDMYYMALQGKLSLQEMDSRANSSSLPEVTVTDMREQLKAGNRSMFGKPLEDAIRRNLQDGKQTMLFLNRRGYSSFMLCRDCGYIVTCSECSASYTYHRDRARLICHYCGLTAPAPSVCPACGGRDIRQFGVGTERVEEEVRKAFGGCSAVRMDGDTTSGKDGHARVLDSFSKNGADILIGTQMIAKGHDFPDVTLVGVLAADAILNFNDYRASERAFQLLTQVSGRAGRGAAAGRVIIQTYNPDHYSVRMAQNHDYKGFYRQEIIARRELLYPPFQAIGAIVASCRDDALARRAIDIVHGRLLDGRDGNGLTVLAPMRPPIGRIREKYRWRCVVKHPDEAELEGMLRAASDSFYGDRISQRVDLSVEVNPFSML
jgi:primosomal protein N' (replication factor Y)